MTFVYNCSTLQLELSKKAATIPNNNYHNGEIIQDAWDGAPPLSEASAMSSLRRDGKALTLLDDAGSTYVLPLLEHDYDATTALYNKGLQIGEVVEDSHGKPVAVKYPDSADFVSLPAVLNAARGVDDAEGDIKHAIDLSGSLFNSMEKVLGVVPDDIDINSVVIDKGSDSAELLPPYHVSSTFHADQVTQALFVNALDSSSTVSEQDMIIRSVRAAKE